MATPNFQLFPRKLGEVGEKDANPRGYVRLDCCAIDVAIVVTIRLQNFVVCDNTLYYART